MSHSVLIVDDSAVIRRMLRSWLETHKEWHVCDEAENGQVAVEKARKLQPDVVILDYQMPVMNGIEAAQQIRTLAPKTAMLLFTMHKSQSLVQDAYAAGIRDVVIKSEGVADQLVTRLRDVCRQL
jgi:DNA-binding NarL/FixJ family response regulator